MNMKTILLSLASAILLLPISNSVAAEVDVKKAIRAEIVVGEAAKAENLLLGVHFTMDPEWHIYWKEPGDSGLPTKITFMRGGEKVSSELNWPKHQTFTQNGNLTTNGYAKEVVLFTEIPKNGSNEISAEVKWLGCSHDLCVPGRASLSADLNLLKPTDLSDWVKSVPAGYEVAN